MSSTMPVSRPTRHGFRDELGCVDVGRNVRGTSSGFPRHRIGLGSIQYGISYSFRRAASKGFLENLKAGCAEFEKGVSDVDARGVSGQESYSSSSDTSDGDNNGQVTPDSTEDVDMSLPPFPDLVNTAGETDWAEYLLWMEDDMSLEERTNNNMLLVGNTIRDVSSKDVITHLSLDIVPIAKRRFLLFKDLPAMRQGQHDGLAMYILGYDAADTMLFVRRFERLSSKIELLPQYWGCGKEVVWLSVGRLLQILQEVDLGDASTSHASVLPEWDEELGFKVVVVAMFAQWVLDFGSGLRMMTEVAEMAQMLLSRWKDSLLTDSAGVMTSVRQFEGEKASHQPYEGVDTTEGEGVVSVRKSLRLKTAHSSAVCDHKTATQASPLTDNAARDRRDTYDSDEEEEWAALEDWAARNKPERQINTAETEPEGRAATSYADLSPDKASEPNDAFLTPERIQSPLDASDLVKLVDTKRFSDSSTLYDGCEENKERLTFTCTVLDAMSNTGSTEAMLKVYSEFVKEHPEHDSEKKRWQLFEFLVAHVGEENGGPFSATNTLEC